MKSSLSKRALAFFTATFLQAAVTFGAVTINTQPAALTKAADGTKITLTVLATSSVPNALTYTWKKRGGAGDTIVKAENSSNQFVIASAKVGDAGSYYVTVRETQTNDTVNSAPDSVVEVNVRPKIIVQPKALANPVLEGLSASYNVTIDAAGTPPFQYTWQKKNGSVYVPVGAMVEKADLTDSITLNNVQLATAGSYRVSITNASGITVNSADVVLKVNSRPVITTQPPPEFNVTFGASGILKLVVGGNAPLKYQWYKGNMLIPKATAATLSIKGTDNAADGVAEGPGVYKVRITNEFTPDISTPNPVFTESANTVVRVIRKPKILTQPQKATIDITGAVPVNHTLSVAMDTAGDEGTLEYQWYKDNKKILGAMADSLSFSPVAWTDRGSYKVVVTTRSAPGGPVIGTVTSASAVLTIISPPIITSQSPPEIYGATKGSVKLFVVATGTAPLTYEWRFRPVGAGAFNPAVIGKAAALTLSNLSNANHQGDYQCTVKNAPKGAVGAPAPLPGSVASVITYVQVDDPPKFTQQTTVLPHSGSVTKGTPKIPAGNKLHLQVKLTGTDRTADEAPPGSLKANPFVVRWLKNGLPFLPVVGGSTTSTSALGVTTLELIIDPVAAGDTAKYSCEVTNKVSKLVSTALAITVSGPPTILPAGQPVAVTGIEESTIETGVTATGGSPLLKYQWQKNFGTVGAPLWSNVAKTAAKLSFSVAQLLDDGVYRCLVTNDFGTTISDTVQVTVTPIPPPTLGAVAGISTVEMYPSIARSGEKVRIYGQFLNYTKSVKFGTATATFVIESANSIVATVPPAASTTPTAIEVKTKNLTPTNTATLFERTDDYFNTLADTTILTETTGNIFRAGDNRAVSLIDFSGRLYYELFLPKRSQVQVTLSNGVVETGFPVDLDLRVYRQATAPSTASPSTTFFGPDGVSPFPVRANNSSAFIGDDTITFSTDRVNQRVLIEVYGGAAVTSIGYVDFGPFTLFVSMFALPTTSSVASPTTTMNITGKWQTPESKEALTITEATNENDIPAIHFGGSDTVSAEPIVLWQQFDASATNGQVVSSFTMSLEPGDAAGDDQFAWQVSDPEGDPLMALWVNAADGTLRAVQPDGTTTTSIQHITPGGGAHRFEIVVDPKEGTWITMMDGVPVTAAIKLPAGAKFGDISAVWDLGADGVSSGASIIFDDFRVEAEVAP